MMSHDLKKENTEIPNTILSIWGRTILGSGWTTIPNELLKNQARLGLSNSELVLLIHLISFMHSSSAKIFPSIELLSERMSQDRRTIQRTIQRLEEKELIRKRVRSKGKLDIGLTNVYDISPLMLKIINIQLPSMTPPPQIHVCPRCKKIAKSEAEIESLFGYRRVNPDKRVIQSWCKECRGTPTRLKHHRT
ncbi:helix-turn-helix domain-containing protein [Citrobacter freundii]|nr:helix-turn-helix domain-containing protein [Citrobacter freundii]